MPLNEKAALGGAANLETSSQGSLQAALKLEAAPSELGAAHG
jgi:hypothetical protein